MIPAPLEHALEVYLRARDAVDRFHGGADPAALDGAAGELADLAASSPSVALALAAVRPDEDDMAHHTVRAGLLAAALGREVGLGEAHLADLFRVALVHEAGNAALPGHVVRRAGALDDEARRELSRAPSLAVARIVREDPPGRTACLRAAVLDRIGAPAALVRRDEHGEVEAFGEAPRTPVVARLLAIGCVYDALTSSRPYRDPFTPPEALAVMWTELAGRFDPALLGVFHHLLGVGPVPVRASRPREAPVLVPEAGVPAAVASISIAGEGTLELLLDDAAAVELADHGEPVIVELAPGLADDGGFPADGAVPAAGLAGEPSEEVPAGRAP